MVAVGLPIRLVEPGVVPGAVNLPTTKGDAFSILQLTVAEAAGKAGYMEGVVKDAMHPGIRGQVAFTLGAVGEPK